MASAATAPRTIKVTMFWVSIAASPIRPGFAVNNITKLNLRLRRPSPYKRASRQLENQYLTFRKRDAFPEPDRGRRKKPTGLGNSRRRSSAARSPCPSLTVLKTVLKSPRQRGLERAEDALKAHSQATKSIDKGLGISGCLQFQMRCSLTASSRRVPIQCVSKCTTSG
jgi:hypothetical protein